MSFRSNGQGRYGHVPPAQYGAQGAPDQNNANGLRRQSSFHNGDDAALDPSASRYQSPPTPGRTPNMPQEELFLSPTSSSPNRTYSSTSSAFSGYQHQYQPSAGASSPPQPQVSYNPQHFARTQPQAPQYRPSTYSNNGGYQVTTPAPQQPNNGGYQPPTPGPQPYNPANYHQPPPTPSRQIATSNFYNNPPSAYPTTPQIPQTPTYWNAQAQHNAPPVPPRPYEHANSAYAPPTPAPPTNNSYNPLYTTPPYPINGSGNRMEEPQTPLPTQSNYTNSGAYSQPANVPSRPSFSEDESSFSFRNQRSSTFSVVQGVPVAMPVGPHSAGPEQRLERHPTRRPLPSAPAEDVGDEDDWGMSSLGKDDSVTQDRLFADIGDSLDRLSSRTGQRNGDLLDSELGGVSRYDSRASTIAVPGGVARFASTASTLAADHHDPNDDYDDESDAEAQAGLEAMRIAEAEDTREGTSRFGTYETNNRRGSHNEDSSDSDYNHMDLGLISGGYDAHFPYDDNGNTAGTFTGNSSEMEDQSRPLPTPDQLNRSDSHDHRPAAGLGGMTDYSIPGGGQIHPFPAFEAARVDEYGTGGLQRPTSQRHRMSFDEGDENSLHARLSMSRQSERSGSESPIRDDMMPELFYHPGMGASPYNVNRPLPSVPPMSENRAPQLLPAGSYRNHQYSNSYGSLDGARPMQVPQDADAYQSYDMLSPAAQYVPRSSSLSSHSSTPQTVPPVRSKTDAEERARAQRARNAGARSGTGVDGYDTGSAPQSSVALDLPALPAGRRKKFSAARLSSIDFKKCKEPWALSGIASWVREMAGGETGEGEADLRQKTIEEAVVALFLHKVPTMNTADAETLSSKVVKNMLDSGILVPDEEWIKFGPGEASGFLWQLSGRGCYAPKLHEHEISGRCYSHHCTRTLKKINLQSQKLGPSRKAEDWVTFYTVTKDQLEGASKKDIELQNNLHEIVQSEDKYMEDINVLRVLYRDDLASWNPAILHESKLPKFIQSVFGKIEAIKEVNENYLLAQLKYRQKEQGPWVLGFSDIFREWIRKARSAYIEYAAGFPYATYLVRKEAARNLLFRQFLDQARENKLSGRLDYNTYLKAPITRLQRYTLLLATALKNMIMDNEEKTNLATAIEEIKTVTLECDAKVDEQSKKVEMIELQAKLFLRPGMERVELNLDHLGRELLFKGDLQRAGANRFTWLETHAILFDHYLVLAKTIVQRDSAGVRKKEIYDVSKLPIPMQLLVLESTNDDPVVKSSVKGIGAVTTVTKTVPGSASEARLQRTGTGGLERSNTLEQTNSSSSVTTLSSTPRLTQTTSNDDTRSMYPFRIKHLGKSETYTLYAPSAQNRQDWCDKIVEAKTRHAAALFEQNAEPFRLKAMADTAFAYDSQSAVAHRSCVSIQGTPLERSIREMEKIFGAGPRPGPVCRAQVNCATTFNVYGKAMVAIGTDYGVYTAEASSPRGWNRTVPIARVTQIAVLEDFSLCIIIADRHLIAYHLDVILPPSGYPAPQNESSRRAPQRLSGARDVSFFGTARMKDRTLVFYKKRDGLHSTFKVLEPIYRKSGEKKARLFGHKKFGSGTTEFFREFDEFYIPAECFSINLFNVYMAIATSKGFELLTLDKKQPISIPDHKNPSTTNIVARIRDQRPLGMFRLSDSEFLLCYEECGVYVDKQGEVSRSVIMEFVGKAKTAAMYGAYLVLFDTDFVEVRNAENGRLRQVIAGRDVRCLDYGVNPLGAGTSGNHTPVNGSATFPEKRTLKLAMAHPEVVGNQIVLEMVLNEGHSE